MRVLPDTSIWIDYFRGHAGAAQMDGLLQQDTVMMPPWLLPMATTGRPRAAASRKVDGGRARARHTPAVASYTLNSRAVARARKLIAARQYVLDSDWGESQPRAEDENAYLASHSWSEYAEWHLALTEGATDETKSRYGFVYGDFRRVHRTGLIACQYRAAEWRHKASSSRRTSSSSSWTRRAPEPR
ncbi:hypothetical protein BH24CHL8_BH24CHL8_06470 [soil metagenome]